LHAFNLKEIHDAEDISWRDLTSSEGTRRKKRRECATCVEPLFEEESTEK
jgi:hypothetical protein